jgi:hypothetical protein
MVKSLWIFMCPTSFYNQPVFIPIFISAFIKKGSQQKPQADAVGRLPHLTGRHRDGISDRCGVGLPIVQPMIHGGPVEVSLVHPLPSAIQVLFIILVKIRQIKIQAAPQTIMSGAALFFLIYILIFLIPAASWQAKYGLRYTMYIEGRTERYYEKPEITNPPSSM